jgi:hypothetical protein
LKQPNSTTMGRFRYDDNEEDEYDIDKNNDNSNDFGWEFVADPGEEGAMVPVLENNKNRDEQHNDDDDDDPATTVSPPTPHQKHQQQQPTFYVVMQQPDQDHGGYFEYIPAGSRRRSRSIYCCPTWFMMCLVAVISHIVWHTIHNGPPAPPPAALLLQQQQQQQQQQPLSFDSNGDDSLAASSSTTTARGRTNSAAAAGRHSSSSLSTPSWPEYLENHSTMFFHSTQALFWELPKHVVAWWFRYMQDEVRQRIQDWNQVPVQYCSVSVKSPSTPFVEQGHENIMAHFLQQQPTGSSTKIVDLVVTEDDDTNDSTSSSSSSAYSSSGLFFAKGQPLATRALADALHAWRPKTATMATAAASITASSLSASSSSSSSSSSYYPPLLLFASAMTPGLAMRDLATTLSHFLIPTSECEHKNHHVNKQRLVLLRPLLHLEASSDWDQDMLARQILDHVQEWSKSGSGGGGIVVLQQVHQLAPSVLAWLVRELSTPPTPSHAGSFSSSSSSSYSSPSYSSPSSSQLYMRCQNVIFLFTSDTIGKASIVRSIRHAATTSAAALAGDDANDNDGNGRPRRPMDLAQDISRLSLTLDIQHEIQVHFGVASVATYMHATLPFLPYTQLDLAEIVTLGMQQFWQESCRPCHYQKQDQQQQRWSRLVTTRAAALVLVHERNVEYIVWKTVLNHGSKSQKGSKTATVGGGGLEASSARPPSPVVLLTFSSTGADPVQRYLVSLQVHLERCLQKLVRDGGSDHNDGNHRGGKQPHQEHNEDSQSQSMILVLDASGNDAGQRGILNECQPNSDDIFIDGLTPTITSTSACTELCSFPLV